MGDCDIDGEEEVELRMRRTVVACVYYNDNDNDNDNGNKRLCLSSLPIRWGAIVPNIIMVTQNHSIADRSLPMHNNISFSRSSMTMISAEVTVKSPLYITSL